MRFSLATLVLLVLWIGALMAVWVRREPIWERAPGSYESLDKVQIYAGPNGAFHAPDGVRWYDAHEGGNLLWEKEQPDWDRTGSNDFLWFRKLCFVEDEKGDSPGWPLGFVDDNTLAFDIGEMEHGDWKSHKYILFHRRFPEWWWGHFYRPEVWLALALSGLLILRAAKSRKRQTIASASSGG